MRIPVYTARTQRSNEMPGKRFNVRKNAEPFVRAELAKGEVASALFDTAGEFAIQRREMIASQQFNEAALRIEEEVSKATSELSKSRDYGNVLDGKNLWGQRMDRIRNEIITTVQLPSLQKKLRHEFDLNEITNRFKLKSVIDQKIIAAEQLSLNSLTQKTKEKLSNLSVQNKNYDLEIQKLVNKYAPGVKSGRFNGDAVISSLGALKKDIAEDVVAQYVGRDPSRAVDLIIALEDAYDNKTEDLQELQAGGDYTMHTLLNIGSDDANEILERALNTAKTFATVIEAERKKDEEAYNFVIDSVKNRYEYYTNAADKNRAFGEADMSQTDLAVPAIRSFFARTPDGVLFADELRSEIVRYLYGQNEVDNTFSNILEKDAEVKTPADVTDKQTYLDLLRLHEEGTLGYADIRQVENLLTTADRTKLSNYVAARLERERAEQNSELSGDQTTSNETFSTAQSLARDKYNYKASVAADNELQKTNEAAYFYVSEKLEQLKLNALGEGRLLTPTEIIDEYNKAVKENEAIYFANVKSDYTLFKMSGGASQTMRDAGYIFVDTPNMLEDFDQWLSSLESPSTAVLNDAPQIRRRLKEFLKTGAF